MYREICTEYAETIYSLQEKNVTDSEALLRLVSWFINILKQENLIYLFIKFCVTDNISVN